MDAEDFDAFDHGGFADVGGGDDDFGAAAFAGFDGDREDAGDGADGAGESEFADEAEFFGVTEFNLLGDGDHAEGDGEIEAGAFFFDAGGGEVDGGASAGPAVAAVTDGGGDAVFAFFDGGVGEPNDDDDFAAGASINLDFYLKGINT